MKRKNRRYRKSPSNVFQQLFSRFSHPRSFLEKYERKNFTARPENFCLSWSTIIIFLSGGATCERTKVSLRDESSWQSFLTRNSFRRRILGRFPRHPRGPETRQEDLVRYDSRHVRGIYSRKGRSRMRPGVLISVWVSGAVLPMRDTPRSTFTSTSASSPN